MTQNSARTRAARRLQANLDIKYVRALRIVDADHAARSAMSGQAGTHPVTILEPVARRVMMAAVEEWIEKNLPEASLERVGLAAPFEWMTEVEIESAGALPLNGVADAGVAKDGSRVLTAEHDVLLMLSGWVNGAAMARSKRRDVDVLEEHPDGSEVLVGPLRAHATLRVELSPDGARGYVRASEFVWVGTERSIE